MRMLAAHSSPLLLSVLVATLKGMSGDNQVATADSLAGLVKESRTLRPDVVLASLTYRDGVLSQELNSLLRSGARVLVLWTEDQEAVTQLLLAGAAGCLNLNECDGAGLARAVRDIAAGNAVLHPAVAAAVLRQWRKTRGDRSMPPAEDPAASSDSSISGKPKLTPRELEVLSALDTGWTTKRIGRELSVSPKTVESHIAKLFVKLNSRNRAQAVSQARQYRLLGASSGPPAAPVDGSTTPQLAKAPERAASASWPTCPD